MEGFLEKSFEGAGIEPRTTQSRAVSADHKTNPTVQNRYVPTYQQSYQDTRIHASILYVNKYTSMTSIHSSKHTSNLATWKLTHLERFIVLKTRARLIRGWQALVHYRAAQFQTKAHFPPFHLTRFLFFEAGFETRLKWPPPILHPIVRFRQFHWHLKIRRFYCYLEIVASWLSRQTNWK